MKKSTCLDKKCLHGQCNPYLNDMKRDSDCQCHSEWRRKYCDIPYQCNCALNSILC